MERKIYTPRNIEAGKEVIYGPGSNVIIDDVGITKDGLKKVIGLMPSRDVAVVTSDQLTDMIPVWDYLPIVQSRRTLVIYPLMGGRKVRKSLGNILSINATEYEAPCTRDSQRSAPQVEIDDSLLKEVKGGRYVNVLIADDVIVSGSTLTAVKDRVEAGVTVFDDSEYSQSTRFGWTKLRSSQPELSWFALSWLTFLN